MKTLKNGVRAFVLFVAITAVFAVPGMFKCSGSVDETKSSSQLI